MSTRTGPQVTLEEFTPPRQAVADMTGDGQCWNGPHRLEGPGYRLWRGDRDDAGEATDYAPLVSCAAHLPLAVHAKTIGAEPGPDVAGGGGPRPICGAVREVCTSPPGHGDRPHHNAVTGARWRIRYRVTFTNVINGEGFSETTPSLPAAELEAAVRRPFNNTRTTIDPVPVPVVDDQDLARLLQRYRQWQEGAVPVSVAGLLDAFAAALFGPTTVPRPRT